MNFDEVVRESFETKSYDLTINSITKAEMLEAIEELGDEKRRGLLYKLSKLFSKFSFKEVLGVTAFVAVLIAVPLLTNHYQTNSKMEAKIDNTPVASKNNNTYLSKDITGGEGVVVTITPRKNLNNSDVKISNNDFQKVIEWFINNEIKAVAINDTVLTKKSSFGNFISKGYVTIDGNKVSIHDRITIKMIGNKEKIYKSLSLPETFFRFSNLADIRLEKLSEISIGASDAQKVVENYFKYMNDKNKEKLLENLTQGHDGPNVVWGFENLDYIKILNIEEETDNTQKNGYLLNGSGKVNGTKEENLKVYRVDYEVKYKKDGVGPQDSGKYTWWFFVIRKDSNSPWLIDEYGV